MIFLTLSVSFFILPVYIVKINYNSAGKDLLGNVLYRDKQQL